MAYPQSISEIIPKVIARLGLTQKVRTAELISSWSGIVGEAVACHTKPVTLDKGCLTINVDSSPWLSELERYSKQKILENIQKKLDNKSVRYLRFRIGDVG